MKDSPHITALYRHIGALCYAMALADKAVRPEELEAFKNEVVRLWRDFPQGQPAYHPICKVPLVDAFEQAASTKRTSESILGAFEHYHASNAELFTPTLKAFILDSMLTIAETVSRKNKSELVFLSQIQCMFYPQIIPTS